MNHLERCLNAIGLSINLVSSIERLEEFADIVAGVVLLECQLGIRPDLSNVNKVLVRLLDDTHLLIDLTELGFILIHGPTNIVDDLCLPLYWQHFIQSQKIVHEFWDWAMPP